MPLSVRQVINSFVFRPLKMRDERRNGDTYRNFNTARRKKAPFFRDMRTIPYYEAMNDLLNETIFKALRTSRVYCASEL